MFRIMSSLAPSLASRLAELSSQLQDFVHEIAEKRKCSLQSLELSLQLGELKVSIGSTQPFREGLEGVKFRAISEG